MSTNNTRSMWSRRGRTLGVATMVATMAATSGWATMAPISGAVVARGTFVVEGDRQKVQYRDGGRIMKIHVALGDVVTAGQLLVTFDVPELEIKKRQLAEARTSLSKRLKLVDDELSGVRKLYNAGLVPKQRYLALERERVQVDGDLQDNRLRQKEVDIQLANSELHSPSAGRVMELVHTAPGSVVRGGDKIMELLPVDAKLVVDVRVDQQQVDDVSRAAAVEVKLPGLNQKTTPTIRGRVLYISPDALTEERTGNRYFQVRVGVEDTDLARYKLGAGMPAEVMIETAPRSLVEYALRPLSDSFARALREPL